MRWKSVLDQPGGARGQYADGKTAALRQVAVLYENGELVIADQATANPVVRWPAAQVRPDLSQDGVLLLHRQGGSTEILSIPLPADGASRLFEPSKRLKIAGLLMILVASGASLFALLPRLTATLAQRVPWTWEEKAGAQLAPWVMDNGCHSPPAEHALRMLVDRLLQGSPPPIPIHVTITRSKEVNAYTLPGAQVLITQALLEEADSPEEVAGVLAHELQHVLRRHVTARLIRASLLSSVWSVTLGHYAGLLVVDPSTIYSFAALSFDRKDESEADAGALAALSLAAIDPSGFMRFFRRLERKDGIHLPQLISTHPSNNARLKMIDAARAGALAKTYRPILGRDEWRALKGACSGSR